MAARPLSATALAAAVLAASLVAGCAGGPEPGVLRLGYFPNLTHAQALYGIASGLYEDALGNTTLRAQAFNAGPTAFESLLAGRVDVIYAGPSPTITVLDRRGLDVVVIVAGTASGGASFVTRAGIDDASDLRGATLATPQLGNTQDVALKHYLAGQRLEHEGRGDVRVVNAANADILTLFQNGHVDGAWVPEPWASRLVLEADGHVFLDEASLWPEGKFVTTHLVTTRAFLRERPDDMRHLLAAHAEATRLLQEGRPETVQAVNDGLERATGKRLDSGTLLRAFPNLAFTTDPLQGTFQSQFEMARDVGFASSAPDVRRAYDLSYLPAGG